MNLNDCCAVIVTFNRKELLLRCLKAVLEQDYPLHAVIVVDNASSDGTHLALRDGGYIQFDDFVSDGEKSIYRNSISVLGDKGFLGDNFVHESAKSIEIIYVRMSVNSGGAGGFYEGQRISIEEGFEWIWLMDDDGYPDPSCLGKLLVGAVVNSVELVNPLVISIEEHGSLSFGLSDSIKTVLDAEKFGGESGVIKNLANPFNGTLINRHLISEVGFIKREMFIWGDEEEYMLRIKEKGYSYLTVVGAKFFHPPSRTTYRSAIFGILKIPEKPELLEMNFYRNLGFLNGRYRSIFSHKTVFKLLLHNLMKFKFGKMLEIIRYYIDGALDIYKLPNVKEKDIT